MPRPLSVVLGDRPVVPVPRTALYAAIDAHLHECTLATAPARGRGLALGAALGLALLPWAADAAVITVASTGNTVAVDGACTLPEAVANANDNLATNADCVAGEAGLDSIVFDPALVGSTISLAGQLIVEDALLIDGDAADGLAVSGAGIDRVLNAYEPLTVANLTIQDGDKFYGGAIRASAPLTVDTVQFLDNDAQYAGGAIYASAGLTVTNSGFSGNEAGGEFYGHGGAIAASGSVTVSGSSFIDNVVYGYGGAIAVSNRAEPTVTAKGVAPPPAAAAVSVIDSTFTNNVAVGSKYHSSAGGAVALVPRDTGLGLQHSLDVDGSSFTGNFAAPYFGPGPQAAVPTGVRPGGKYPSSGGAVAVLSTASAPLAKGLEPVDAVAATIADSVFDANSALFGGGAAVFASSVTVTGSSFEDNVGILGGGALLGPATSGPYYAAEGSVSLGQTTFQDNAAAGGAGLLASAAIVSVADLTVTGNIAGSPYSAATATSAKGATGKYLPPFQCSGGKYIGGMGLVGSNVTVTGATTVSNNCADEAAGGSIVVQYGGSGLVAAGVVFDGNNAVYDIGGVELIASDDATLVFGGTVTGNTAGYSAGGIQAAAEGTGALTLSGATVSGNSAGASAATGAGGGLLVAALGGSVTITGTTISGNSAAASGAGVQVLGAPPVPPPAPARAGKGAAAAATVLFENSTVHGNQVTGTPGNGGGITFANYATGTLSFVTVTGNTASGSGGGLFVDANASATLRNSIVAGNTAASAADLSGAAEADFVLLQDATGATLTGADNQTGMDPLLGPLQDNGGPTLTRMPLAASPARNTGDPAFGPPPDFDQRGAGFPRVVNGVVDKGAVEAPPPAVLSFTLVPAAIAEGDGAVFTATLDGTTGADALLTLAFSGAAALGADFSVADADAGTAGIQLLVPAGSSSGTAALSALDDSVDEPDEGFTATVAAATGASLTGTPAASGTILDNDAVPSVTLSLSQSTVLEEGGSTSITATLSAPSSQDVTITLGFSGSAVQGTDYSVTGTQIVIPAGQTSGSVLLSTIDDGLDEGDETVVVDILAVSNAQESGTQQGTVVIDDTADGTAQGPGANPQPVIIPTLSEWMLMLLGLLLPATVAGRLRRRTQEAPRRR